jgi:uncharacterized protein (TIGR03084 family)
VEIFDDLTAEQERIEAFLAELDTAAWTSPSAAAGWSVADVVLHLAQSEEAVTASVSGGAGLVERLPTSVADATSLDDVMDKWVAAERTTPPEIFDRWRRARRAALEALRGADPQAKFPWAAAPLKPTALATTRLAEHWAHALDIVGPLEIDYPDTDRLRHIAWLAHRTLPYGFGRAGLDPQEVRCELTAPDGVEVWTYGPESAPSTIVGAAGAFCRVGAQRLIPDQSGLTARGPHGATALSVLRNYAG